MSKTTLICFANEQLTLQEDGWAMLAPLGTFPGVARQVQEDGTVKKIRALQVLDHAAATEMVNEFNSLTGKVRRWLRGVPIYAGHPDMPGGSDRWPDKRTLGTATTLQVREKGIYCQPVFTNDGAEFIESTEGIGMSGRWTGVPIGEVDGLPAFRPAVLRSIGLTANPNLPVELLNEADAATQTQPPDTMDKTKLMAGLRLCGVDIANEAAETDLEVALARLSERVKAGDAAIAAQTQFANERAELQTKIATADGRVVALTAERDTARTEFANERKVAAALKLDAAIAAGRITQAQRPEWEPKLVADFANEAPKLDALKPAVKTASIMALDAGRRRVELANESPAGRFRALVKAEHTAGRSKAEAIQRAIGKNPDLYVEFLNSGAVDLGLD